MISSKTYDVLKWIALVFLPALTTFYGVVAKCLNIPYTQEVITIAVAFDTFLGALLGISCNAYKKLNDDNYGYDEENDPTEGEENGKTEKN